jgi:hypothetical protein
VYTTQHKYQFINNLPYPLGLLYRNLCKSYIEYQEKGSALSWKEDLFALAYAFSHFLAVVHIKQYLSSPKNSFSSKILNKQILQTFRSKEETKWHSLLAYLLQQEQFLPFIQEMPGLFKQKLPASLLKEEQGFPQNTLEILEYFLQLSPTETDQIPHLMFLMDFFIETHAYLCDYFVLIPEKECFWHCQGTLPETDEIQDFPDFFS